MFQVDSKIHLFKRLSSYWRQKTRLDQLHRWQLSGNIGRLE